MVLVSVSITGCGSKTTQDAGSKTTQDVTATLSVTPEEKAASACAGRVVAAYDSIHAFTVEGQDGLGNQVYKTAAAQWGLESREFKTLSWALTQEEGVLNHRETQEQVHSQINARCGIR